jgi:hypothetical protein
MQHSRLDWQHLLGRQMRSVPTHNNSAFFLMLREAARQLISLHDQSPKIGRYIASLQKSLLTQAVVALHLEGTKDPRQPALTAARLIDFAMKHGVASKNTVASHLAELRAYRIIVEAAESNDRRARPLEVSKATEDLMRQWFEGQLACLDMLDEGGRQQQSAENPGIFALAQPRIARRLALEKEWSNPPPGIGAFVWTEYGASILQHLIARLPDRFRHGERISIGSVLISDFPRRYTISLSHTQRMFLKAKQDGLVGWDRQARANDFWISSQLVQQYERWQFAKFSILSEEFEWAFEQAAA